jgi:ribosomal protein S27AE
LVFIIKNGVECLEVTKSGTPVEVAHCPFCGNVQTIRKRGIDRYYCSECGITFWVHH